MADYFKRPDIPPPERDSTEEYRPEEVQVPADVSEETLEEITPIQNPFRAAALRVAGLQRKARRLSTKIKGTLAYHVADLDLTFGPETPPHIRQIMEDLLNIPSAGGAAGPDDPSGGAGDSVTLTKEQMDCVLNVAQTDTNAKTAADLLNDALADEGSNEFALTMIEKMSKKKFTFGLEFLLRLIRMCLAYAVHMIVGGLCSFFMGKLNVPIPYIGSYPVGTLIAMSILFPTEATAKAALGFPCAPNIPLPDDCFGLFNSIERDVHNLLPCCIDSGLSGMAIRMQEMQEKLKGGPLSSNIESFIGSFKVKGGFKDGYIAFGDVSKVIIDNDISKIVDDSKDSTGGNISSAVKAVKKSLEDLKEFSGKVEEAAASAKEFVDKLEDQTVSAAAFSANKLAGVDVAPGELTIFKCWAQAVASLLHDEGEENPYKGPPCSNPSSPYNPSTNHQQQAEQFVQYVVQKNAVGGLMTTIRPTNPGNIMNLLATLKKTEDLDTNMGELRGFLKDNQDLLNPSTRRCLEESSNLSFGGPDAFSKLKSFADPEEFFSKLDTDNSMDNLSFTPEGYTQIAGGDIGDLLAGGLAGTGGVTGEIGKTMESVIDGIEEFLEEADKFVSGVNKLAKFFTSKEFCCVIYVIVLMANVARGKTICPTDDISSFFKYSTKISDKRNVAMLKMQLSFLKAMMDAIRESLAIRLEVKGIAIPLKDLMERVRYTITQITDVLIDAASEPIEKALDAILLNPEIAAMVKNNCLFAFDILSVIKCALEWIKLKIRQIALELFENNFQNIELMRNLRIGGMRFKILDLLSKLLGLLLDLLLGIGDCYDGDDYMRQVVGKTLEQQYSEAERVFAILEKANVTPEEVDEWSSTLSGEDPLDIDPAEAMGDSSPDGFMNDSFFDFQGALLTDNFVNLLRAAAPLSAFVDGDTGARRLVSYEEFVERIEQFTGTTLSEAYIHMYNIDSGIHDLFAGKSK